VDLDGMVTGHFSLDDVEEALSQEGNPDTMKVIVRPGGLV
jgi:hypothetical protein